MLDPEIERILTELNNPKLLDDLLEELARGESQMWLLTACASEVGQYRRFKREMVC
jgi:hypothetical protein